MLLFLATDPIELVARPNLSSVLFDELGKLVYHVLALWVIPMIVMERGPLFRLLLIDNGDENPFRGLVPIALDGVARSLMLDDCVLW